MTKPFIAIWNLLIRISLVYYGIFLVLMILGVSDLMDVLIPSKDLQNSLREFFSIGMILFWIYLTFIPLKLTGILRMEKKAFMTMVILVAITIFLFVYTETS